MFQRIKSNNSIAVKKAIDVLNEGGVIIYPTDTIYGFGCNANNHNAIKKINLIKGRKGPMSVLAPSKRTALKWMNLSKEEKFIVEKKIGGDSTVIVPIKNDIVSHLITGPNQSLGIRIPDHSFCNEISNNYPEPITTTSVNRTGYQPLTIPDQIENEFSNDIELLVDDGIINGKGSTIYIFQNKKWKILRS